jgi:hypothetical protein
MRKLKSIASITSVHAWFGQSMPGLGEGMPDVKKGLTTPLNHQHSIRGPEGESELIYDAYCLSR